MKIKKYIALAVTTLCLAASAQNPTLKTFKVGFRTTEGKDTVIEVSTISTNTFKFVGSGGKVQIYNETTQEWETTEEENSDVYMNVTSVTEYRANFSLSFSKDAAELPVNEFGCCISKAPRPTVSEFSMRNNYGTFDISEFFNKYGEGCYTMYLSKSKPADCSLVLNNLDYVTTYYVRPFIKLTNGFVMYGGEKSFTTLRTKAAALDSEEGMEGHLLLGDSIVIQQKALHSLLDYAEPSLDLLCGAQQDVSFLINSMSGEERAKFLKKCIYKTIECVDGNLHLIKEFPADFAMSFKDGFGAGIEYSVIGAIREKGVVSADTVTVYCAPSQGVPYNSYLSLLPFSRTGNPEVNLNIPKYMHNKEYNIYVVLVHPDIANDPRPNKLRVQMFEREIADSLRLGAYRKVPFEAPDEAPHVDGRFVTDITKSVDTLYIGRYTFKGTPESYINIRSNVGRQETDEYNNTVCLSQIRIIPVKEDE